MTSVLPSNIDLNRLRFDPNEGTVVREPLGRGYGYWAGGMKVSFDKETGKFVLFYRLRTPLEFGRGGKCALAVSDDGVHFDDVWTATKEQFASTSVEVGHCFRDLDGKWRFYLSYEFAENRAWRVDVMMAKTVESIDPQSRRTCFQAYDYGLSYLKDPIAVMRDGKYWVYVAGPSLKPPVVEGNVIRARSLDSTFLGVSEDGLRFPEIKCVFESPDRLGWDGRRARINSLIPMEGGWLTMFDGGQTTYDQYEELAGVAWSTDGENFTRVPMDAPWVKSPYGCVRYVFGLRVENEIFYYYEYTREDLSHDLRVSKVKI